MTVIVDLSSLRAAVRDRLARSDISDATINGHVRLVEAHIRRQMELLGLEKEDDYSITASDQALPADLENLLYLRTTGNQGCKLERKTQDQMQRFRDESTGPPRFYTLVGDTTNQTRIQFLPLVNGTFEARIGYRIRAQLTNDGDTNTVLNDHPDVYLNGCLHYAKLHFEDYEGADRYNAMFFAALDAATMDDVLDRFGDGPLTPSSSYIEGAVQR